MLDNLGDYFLFFSHPNLKNSVTLGYVFNSVVLERTRDKHKQNNSESSNFQLFLSPKYCTLFYFYRVIAHGAGS